MLVVIGVGSYVLLLGIDGGGRLCSVDVEGERKWVIGVMGRYDAIILFGAF